MEGRRATTHWGRSRDFRTRYPQVRLEPDRIFVRDGEVWTSACISAGIDLALAIIAEEFHATSAAVGWIPTLSFGGMLTGTFLAIFFVPLFFVVVRKVFPGRPATTTPDTQAPAHEGQ